VQQSLQEALKDRRIREIDPPHWVGLPRLVHNGRMTPSAHDLFFQALIAVSNCLEPPNFDSA